MRWIVLDEIVSIEKGLRAKTRSRVPEVAYSPEVLMMEMMAQTGGLLLGAEHDFSQDLIFAKIEKAEFLDGRKPGEIIEIEAYSESLRPEGAWFDARIERSDGKGMIAESRFLLMNVGRLIPGKTESTTFHRAFLDHFRVREKIK